VQQRQGQTTEETEERDQAGNLKNAGRLTGPTKKTTIIVRRVNQDNLQGGKAGRQPKNTAKASSAQTPEPATPPNRGFFVCGVSIT
jgi:hypothetical protein